MYYIYSMEKNTDIGAKQMIFRIVIVNVFGDDPETVSDHDTLPDALAAVLRLDLDEGDEVRIVPTMTF